MRGGYQIIDFKGRVLNPDAPVVISGLYKSIVECKDKAIMIVNVNIEGESVPAVWANVFRRAYDGLYTISFVTTGIYVRYLSVSTNDTVQYFKVSLSQSTSTSNLKGDELK